MAHVVTNQQLRLQATRGDWCEVGNAMDTVLLNAETREKEMIQRKPLRFKVPEFEAMKRRLEQGLLSATDKTGQKTVDGYGKEFDAAQGRASLPDIKPSLFGRGEVFVLAGTPFNIENSTAGAQFVDSLSAFHGMPFRFRIERPAFYVGENADMIVAAWDVGEITAKFDKPVRLQGITRRGRPTALDIQLVGMSFNPGGCYGLNLQINSETVRAMPHLAGHAGRLGRQAGDRQGQGKKPDALEIDDIGLDGDGIADFSVWNGRYEPQISAEDLWQAIYVNIASQWLLLSFEQDADYT